MEYIVSEEEVSEAVKIKQMELQFEREKLVLVRERLDVKGKKDKEIENHMPILKLKQFDLTKHICFVPPFRENEVDKYFLPFPNNLCYVYLVTVLNGITLFSRFFCM